MEQSPNADLAARLRRAVTRLNRRLRQSSLGGTSPAQASMLASIEKLERPSLGDLAAVEQIQPPSVTRIVKALESSGLIETSTDPIDRRCTRVALTPAGRREVTTIRRRKTEFLESRIRNLDADDQERAADMVAMLEQILGES